MAPPGKRDYLVVVSILAYSWALLSSTILLRPRPKSKRAYKSIPNCLLWGFVVECTHPELVVRVEGGDIRFPTISFFVKYWICEVHSNSHQVRLTPAAQCIKSPFVASVDSLFVGESVVRLVDPSEAETKIDTRLSGTHPNHPLSCGSVCQVVYVCRSTVVGLDGLHASLSIIDNTLQARVVQL